MSVVKDLLAMQGTRLILWSGRYAHAVDSSPLCHNYWAHNCSWRRGWSPPVDNPVLATRDHQAAFSRQEVLRWCHFTSQGCSWPGIEPEISASRHFTSLRPKLRAACQKPVLRREKLVLLNKKDTEWAWVYLLKTAKRQKNNNENK